VVALLGTFLTSSIYAQCGVERWSVKTGTDPQAPSVNLGSYVSSTIYNMQQSVRPASLPANGRVAPRETTQYRVTGTLIGYKRESDSDYHLVIKDGSGRTMIIEIPSINCVGGGSPFGSGIRNARAQFDARLTATTSYKTVSAPVAIRGVGFWDFLHGQTGVAPNGIEIHPVLDVQFTGTISAATPAIASNEAPPAATMPADMVEDNDGGRVQVFRGGDAIANILFHGGVVIENPRMQIVFVGDHFDAASRESVLRMARGISSDLRYAELERYGVRATGMAVDARQIADRESGRLGTRALALAAPHTDLNDLDIQRLLADAVADGRLQLTDDDAITVVVLDPALDVAVGTTRDWTSYHSLFHPTERAMPYVVVRNVADGAAFRESLYASVMRTIVNPAGNGWY
jgi:hypothetical protein